MSLGSISSQLPRNVEQTQGMERRLEANQGNGVNSTMIKIASVFAAVVLSGLVFTFGGTTLGLITVGLCFITLARRHRISSLEDLATRYMNGQPPPGGHHHHAPHEHVGVGAGHDHGARGGYRGGANVPVGQGHDHGARGGYRGGANVPVGQGHAPGVPGGHPPHGHPRVNVGRGHTPGGSGSQFPERP